MGFFDELTNLFTPEELDNSFKLECIGSSAVLITGYKKLVSLGETQMEILVHGNAKVVINGAKLYIKKLEESEIVVAGRILTISFG